MNETKCFVVPEVWKLPVEDWRSVFLGSPFGMLVFDSYGTFVRSINCKAMYS